MSEPRDPPSARDDPRRRAAYAVLIAMGLALAVTVAAGSGSQGAVRRLGGDLPSFYSAGAIVRDGDARQLYDVDRQVHEQAGLFGDDPAGGYIFFAYPPYVALPYAVLSALPFRAAYVVQVLVMAGCLVAALWLLRPIVPLVDRRYVEVLAVSMTFFPLNEALRSSQNTALSLLLIVAAWRLAIGRRLIATGALLGLLTFKPQLAAVFVVLFLLVAGWRVLIGFLPVVAGLWAVGALMLGPGWVSRWLTVASAFNKSDSIVNGHSTVSWLFGSERVFGVSSRPAHVVAGLLIVATGVWLLMLFLAARKWPADHLHLAIAGAISGGLLISPHAQSYEAALLVLVGLVLLEHYPAWVVGGLFALAYLHTPTAELGLTILLPINAIAFGLTISAWRRRPPRVPVFAADASA